MKVAEVELKNAEKVKNKLIEIAALNTEFLPKKEGERLYFPLLEDADVSLVKEIKIVEKDMPKKKKKIDILDEFSEFLTSKEIEDMPKSQEIVGDIMILEIPENLIGKEKKIAKTYLENNKNVKVVVKKSAIHSGQFRTRKVEVLAGENRKDTTHLESKIRLYLDLEKTYFSTRLGNERLRIAKLVSKGEKVLIMFSGSGPYPLILAKHSEAKKIIGIELNPDAHQFAIENRKKNKINEERVELINGDVKSEVPKLKDEFDRILMPLPKTSEEFLDVALPKIKKKGTIHIYAFLNEKDIEEESKRMVKLCKEIGFSMKLMNTVKCGQHAPYTFRVCFDLVKL